MTIALLRPQDFSLRPVELSQPLEFGRSTAKDLRLLRQLRESISHGVRLTWQLGGLPSIPLVTHVHLPPPAGGVDAQTRAYATRWAAAFRYGSYYYRQGPGFVSVRDVRRGADPVRMVISVGASDFLAIAEAEQVDDLSPNARQKVPAAVAAGLVLVADRTVLVLPYRMRHWPVPVRAG